MKPILLSSLDLKGCESEIKKVKKKFKIIYSKESRRKTLDLIKNCSIYLCSASIKIDNELLENAKKLKYIFTPSTGTDHIDKRLIKKKNIKLIHIAKDLSLIKSFTATSELGFGLLLSILRNLSIASNAAKKGNWLRSKFKGQQLFNKTIGIIGYGRLGKITAKIAKGFGLKILVFDIKKFKNLHHIKFVSLHKLLRSSDYIFIHVHLTKKTEKLLNKKNMKFIKKNSIIINTSRGKIIDENSLLYLLKSKKILGAGLDVIDGEWLSQKKLYNHKLISYSRKNPNLLITPHIGGATLESIVGARRFILKKILNISKF